MSLCVVSSSDILSLLWLCLEWLKPVCEQNILLHLTGHSKSAYMIHVWHYLWERRADAVIHLLPFYSTISWYMTLSLQLLWFNTCIIMGSTLPKLTLTIIYSGLCIFFSLIRKKGGRETERQERAIEETNEEEERKGKDEEDSLKQEKKRKDEMIFKKRFCKQRYQNTNKEV